MILHPTHVVDASKGIRSQKNVAPKIFMMAQLKRGHCTARSTVLAALPAMIKDQSGRGQAPNGTAYTRSSCHSGLANPVQIVSTPPAPSNGGTVTVIWASRSCGSAGNTPHKSGRCRDLSRSDYHTQISLGLRYLPHTN